MAKTGLKQLIHDIKEAYVSATGDTEAITYGNLATKIANIRSGGGGVIGGHTVTFKADGNDYAIVSVTDGQSISAPIPNPTSENGGFVGWLNGETFVDFPLTPTEDITLMAKFAKSRPEMEWNGNGFWFSANDGGRRYTKTNELKTIQGYGYVGWHKSSSGEINDYCLFVCIGETEEAVKMTSAPNGSIKNITYDGKVYYYFYVPEYSPYDISTASNTWYASPNKTPKFDGSDYEGVAKAVLDRYFCKD